MRNFLNLLYKYHYLLLFLFLEGIALFLIMQNNSYHRAKYVQFTAGVSGGMFSQISNLKMFLSLKETNRLLSLENTDLKNKLAEPRLDMLKIFKELGVKPTSMIDISDGLSSEILHLCEDSGVGCRLYEDRIPYDDQTKRMAQELNINPLVAALNGGEDYELLFTIPLVDHDKIRNHPDITILGHMVPKEEGAKLITAGTGMEIPLEAQGWNPLKKE
jgi:thiamine-monophosphate kinase